MQRRNPMLGLGNTWCGIKALLTSKMVQSRGQVVLCNRPSLSLLASDSFLGSPLCNLIMPSWHPWLLAILLKGAYGLVHKHKRQCPLICSHIAGTHNLELVWEFSRISPWLLHRQTTVLTNKGSPHAVLWTGTTWVSTIGPFSSHF